MQHTSGSRAVNVLRGLLFCLIGLVFLGVSAYQLTDRVQFLGSAQAADGMVESLRAGGSHPQVAFTTAQGQRISYPQNGLIFGYQQGQAVRVFYAPEQPQASAVIDDLGALWGFPVVMGLIGAVFAVVGLRSLFKRQ
ncbi:MAG: hypothetical protein GAK45_02079 [Pseudomonas citronellolis]|nr:MAG: hypothetical protein GAK45_02079 [Pseudomonas citronellolis]